MSRGAARQGQRTASSPVLPLLASWQTVAWFCAAVLLLSAMQLLPPLLHEDARRWFEPITLLLGGGLSPAWAMLIVGYVLVGRAGMRKLVRVSLRLKVSPQLYGLALVLPLAGVAAAAVAVGARPRDLELAPVVFVLQVMLVAPIFALAENLGWRAWLQRALQSHWSAASAGAAVGVVWALWHAPLFLVDFGTVHAQLSFPAYALLLVTFSTGLGLLFDAAEGSIAPVVVAHVAFNVAVQTVLPDDPAAATRLLVVTAALFGAIVVWMRARRGAWRRL